MTAQRLREYLETEGVDYEIEEHETVYPAHEVAHAEHVSGWDVAKCVMLSAGDDLVMAVVPAPVDVDLDKAASVLGSEQVRLADEDEFGAAFPDCELGAQPPFGHLYDVPTLVDESFRERDRIIARDGSHTGTVTLTIEDYLRLAEADVVDVSTGPH